MEFISFFQKYSYVSFTGSFSCPPQLVTRSTLHTISSPVSPLPYLHILYLFSARSLQFSFILGLVRISETFYHSGIFIRIYYILMNIPSFFNKFADLYDYISQLHKGSSHLIAASCVARIVRRQSFSLYASSRYTLPTGVAVPIAGTSARTDEDLQKMELVLNESINETNSSLSCALVTVDTTHPRFSLLRSCSRWVSTARIPFVHS